MARINGFAHMARTLRHIDPSVPKRSPKAPPSDSADQVCFINRLSLDYSSPSNPERRRVHSFGWSLPKECPTLISHAPTQINLNWTTLGALTHPSPSRRTHIKPPLYRFPQSYRNGCFEFQAWTFQGCFGKSRLFS